jgi:NADH-quinone oxidoreductase subunit G
VADISLLDRVLVVGSFLRKDHPLIAQRLRQSAKKRAQINLLHCAGDDPLIALANSRLVAPAELASALDAILAALEGKSVDAASRAIAASLAGGRNVGLFLGNLAVQSTAATQLHARLQAIADRLVSLNAEAMIRFGFLVEAANSVGAELAGVMPGAGGANARRMVESALQAYLVVNAEPALDFADGLKASKAMAASKMTVLLTPFRHSLDCADVLLPVAPFTETGGTFINAAGVAQSFNGVVKPLGESRPAWKALRVLGNLLGLAGFDYDSVEAVREDCLPADFGARLDNRTSAVIAAVPPAPPAGFQRIADVPIYSADAIVRRAGSLAQTVDARAPRARMNAADLERLGVADGAQVRIDGGGGQISIAVSADAGVPAGCVGLSGANAVTYAAGALTAVLGVERG